MAELKKTQKAKVFISSLNRYSFGGGDRILSDFRRDMAEKIEERFPFLVVDINEDWPPIAAGSPRRTTQYQAKTCQIFIGILVDDYGYEEETGLSATQVEFEAALDDSPEKMLVFMQKALSDPETFDSQPEPYRTLIADLQDYRQGKIVAWFEDEEDLAQAILDALDLYCADTLRAIRRFPAYASDKTPEEARWELMTFTERYQALRNAFGQKAGDIHLHSQVIGVLLPNPSKTDPDRYRLEITLAETPHELPVLFSACPDRFSYPDAARYVGYPFRTRVEGWDDRLGPLHLILIFRTITDTQVRRHLGNPDIHVSKEGWGFFAADPERFIQVAYLTNCISPRRSENQIRRFLVWLDEYDQAKLLIGRAEVRGRILQARTRDTP